MTKRKTVAYIGNTHERARASTHKHTYIYTRTRKRANAHRHTHMHAHTHTQKITFFFLLKVQHTALIRPEKGRQSTITAP